MLQNRLARSKSLPALVLKNDLNILVCKYCKNNYLLNESKCPCRDDVYPVNKQENMDKKKEDNRLKNLGKSKSEILVMNME